MTSTKRIYIVRSNIGGVKDGSESSLQCTSRILDDCQKFNMYTCIILHKIIEDE